MDVKDIILTLSLFIIESGLLIFLFFEISGLKISIKSVIFAYLLSLFVAIASFIPLSIVPPKSFSLRKFSFCYFIICFIFKNFTDNTINFLWDITVNFRRYF